MSTNPDYDSNSLPDPVTTLWAEPAEVFQLRGGNFDFISSMRVKIQAMIDQVDQIKNLSEDHIPFNLPLYWTNQGDSNSFIPETAIPDFADDMKALLVEARDKLNEHSATIRQARSQDITDYSALYQKASKEMKAVHQQYKNFINAIFVPWMDHDSSEVTPGDLIPHELDTNVMSTVMTTCGKLRAATSISAHSRFYDNGSEVVYRKTHIGNLNAQSLRTFKRMVELLGAPFDRTSVVLAGMTSKYAGSDMSGSASALATISGKFSDLLDFVGSLKSAAQSVTTEFDEYEEESRNSTDGDINAPTSLLKSQLKTYASYFDGVHNTKGNGNPIEGDLLRKIFLVTAPLIASSSWNITDELA